MSNWESLNKDKSTFIPTAETEAAYQKSLKRSNELGDKRSFLSASNEGVALESNELYNENRMGNKGVAGYDDRTTAQINKEKLDHAYNQAYNKVWEEGQDDFPTSDVSPPTQTYDRAGNPVEGVTETSTYHAVSEGSDESVSTTYGDPNDRTVIIDGREQTVVPETDLSRRVKIEQDEETTY